MSKKKENKEAQKIELLKALEESYGIIAEACRKIGITRQTYYNYYNEDQDFKATVEHIQESAIDFVEGKLFQKINGVQIGKVRDGELEVYDTPPSDTAIIFYLKTKAKHRGYVERQELTGKDGEDLYSNMSEEEIQKQIDETRGV